LIEKCDVIKQNRRLISAAGLALRSSVVDVSEAAIASLLTQSALTLALRDKRGLALRWAKVVLWSNTILTSHEAGSKEGIVDFAIHIAFQEVALGLHW